MSTQDVAGIVAAVAALINAVVAVTAFIRGRKRRRRMKIGTTVGVESKTISQAKSKADWHFRISISLTVPLVVLAVSLFSFRPSLLPQDGAPLRPEITWLNPHPGAEVGWETAIRLRSRNTTEKVTILVRPHTGETYYVQHGAAPLSANTPQSFEIQLAGQRQQQIGTEFDIVAVCSDDFEPNGWVLDTSDVPHSAIVARITVVKAAGAIRLAPQLPQDEGLVRVEGDVWTPNGAALLVREEQAYKVLETLPSSPAGSQFSKGLSVPASRRNAIYLLVYRMNSPTVAVDQKIPEIAPDSYWLYGPAK